MSREAPTENNVAHAGEEKKKKKREEPWLFKESRVFHVLTRDQSPCHETFLNYRRCPSPLWARGERGRGGRKGQIHLGPVGTERVIVGIPAFLHDWCQINTALSYSARGLFYL